MMSTTSKSPKPVLLTALKIARASLPAHSHKNSPKKFTQHQLFACPVLKNFLHTDYRGLVESLTDCHSLCKAIELNGAHTQHHDSLADDDFSTEPDGRNLDDLWVLLFCLAC